MQRFLIFVYEKCLFFFALVNPEVLGLRRWEVILLNGAIHEQSISTKIIDTAELLLEKNNPDLT